MSQPLRTPEQHRRRRAILGWVPSAIIVVILAGAVGIVSVVNAQGIGQPRTLPPAVGPHGYSEFDAAGLGYISDTRTVWIDLRVLPISTSSVKLKPGATVEIAPREGVSNYLGLYGKGTAVKLPVDSITIRADGARLALITAQEPAPAGFLDLQNQLEQSTAYGIPESQVSAFLDEARGLNRAASSYTRVLGPGMTLGVPVTVVVSCDRSAACSVQYRIDVSAH